MAEWRIVCIKKKIIERPESHLHISNVGTGERPDWADMRWDLDQVFQALYMGDTFSVHNMADGRIIPIEKYTCPICGQLDIRMFGEGGAEYRLVNLRECIYK